MGVLGLDHYSIRTTELEATSRFYVEVLGFAEGERPPFSFPGVWLYCADKPVVHLIGIAQGQVQGSGAVDHLAFEAAGIDAVRARLVEMKLPFEERQVPVLERHQIFVDDPNGITLELNFPS